MQKICCSVNELNRSFCKPRTDCSFPISVSILLFLCVKDLNLSPRDLGFTVFPSTYAFLQYRSKIVGLTRILQKFKCYAAWMSEDFLPYLSLSLELYLHIWDSKWMVYLKGGFWKCFHLHCEVSHFSSPL